MTRRKRLPPRFRRPRVTPVSRIPYREGTRSETNQDRLRRLRRSANAFAITHAVSVSLISALPLAFGFHLWKLVTLSALLVPFILLWLANHRTFSRIDPDIQSPTIPKARVVISTIGAIVVAFATILWVFKDDTQTEIKRVAAEHAKWEAEVQHLQTERATNQEISKRPLPTAENDHEVNRLEGDLDQKKTQLRDAELRVLCELDGTCGTRVPGKGNAYHERVADRDQLEQIVNDLSRQLESMKTELRGQIHQLAQEKVDAEKAVADFDTQPQRPEPPKPSSRVALITVTERKPVLTFEVSFATFATFLAVDLLALFLIVRYVCRRPDTKDHNVRQLSKAQSERDRRARQGAVLPGNLSPHMRSEYLHPRDGE